jgi:hypothetical protein
MLRALRDTVMQTSGVCADADWALEPRRQSCDCRHHIESGGATHVYIMRCTFYEYMQA